VTPADKPGSTGQNPDRESERTSGVATDGQATPVEPASDDREESPEAAPSANGSIDGPTATVATSEDLELSHGTPPPWQRVANDSQAMSPTPPATPPPPQPSAPAGPPPPDIESRPGEKTVSIERPVVTGVAAVNLFADNHTPTQATMPAPGVGMPPAGGPSRKAVNLESPPPPSAAAPLRVNSAATPSALRRPGRGPRRANLQIKRFDPWSVLKLSLVLGVALFFVWLVAVGVLYAVLDGMGVWDKVNGISSEILQPTDQGGGEPLISAGRVFGVAAIIGAVNIVLFSALSTVGAFVYNVSADLAGGLEVTLAERE
jgi:transmembrane protein DUF3566